MLSPRDDLILQCAPRSQEIVAIARDTDDEIAVLLRVRLGIA